MKLKSLQAMRQLIEQAETELDDVSIELLEQGICDPSKLQPMISRSEPNELGAMLNAAIKRFKGSRESFLAAPDLASKQASLSVLMYQLITTLKEHAHLAQTAVNDLLHAEDDWLIATGFDLMNQSEISADTSLIDRTLQIMRDNGPNHKPYTEGEYLAKILDQNQTLYPPIIDRFENENSRFKCAILSTFYLCQSLPVEAESLILKTAMAETGDIKNNAIMAASNCTVLKHEAIALLQAALAHDDWFIRGNAAESLGYLKVKDPKIILKIVALFGDVEGHDWCAEECAIRALGLIGEPARIAIPQLLELLKQELFAEYGRDENKLLDICESLGKIDDGSDQVIAALTEVFIEAKVVAVSASLRALSRFGKKSRVVLPHLKKYIYDDEYMEGDYMTEDSADLIILKCLLKIDGPNSVMLADFMAQLKSSNHPEDRQIAASFAKQLQYQ